jgi:hypothetical protein
MVPPEEEQELVLYTAKESPVVSRPYDENMVSKLERLGKLRQDGLLTEEEFTIAKRKVLGLE